MNQIQMRQCHRKVLVPLLVCGSETMIWRENERSVIRTVTMDKLRGLLGIRRMDKILNVWIRQLCKVKKKVQMKRLMVNPCGENGEGQD